MLMLYYIWLLFNIKYCMRLNDKINLGEILEPSKLVLALYPNFWIFLLSLCTHSFWSSWLGASINSSLADFGSLCNLHGAIASSLRSKCSLWTLILQPKTKINTQLVYKISLYHIFYLIYFYTPEQVAV